MQRETLLIPGNSGEIRAPRDSRPWAWWSNSSILSLQSSLPNLPTLTWSGSLAELEGGALFDEDPRTWGPKGWAALEHAVARLTPAGHTLLIRPHHRHIISDIPSCKRLLESPLAAATKLRLAYDPLSMCTHAMQASGKFTDHLHRIFEAANTFPPGSLAALILPQNHHENSLLATLLESHIPTQIPLLLSPP